MDEAQTNVESLVARREFSGFLGAHHFGEGCREAVDYAAVARQKAGRRPIDFFGMKSATLQGRDAIVNVPCSDPLSTAASAADDDGSHEMAHFIAREMHNKEA